ncbi:MAG: iron ABC transporter permease [Treponema sp.]|nr:iron ABC transporter permease [Treponema sp.]
MGIIDGSEVNSRGTVFAIKGRTYNFTLSYLLALPLFLAVGLCFFLPYGGAFAKAVEGGLTGGITVLQNRALWNITSFTLRQAFFSVLLSLAIGLPGAWYLSKRGRLAPVLRTLSAVPFAMPSILVVLGFVLFYGNSGWLNQGLGSFGGPVLRILYRPEAIILAHGFFNFPLVIRLAGDGLDRARRAYSPAAAVLGASPIVTALTVTLPLAIPAIMSAVLLVFLYSFTSFAVVLVLGGGPASTTLAVEIYRHGRIFLNYANAGTLAFAETIIAVIFFLSYVFFNRKAREIKTGTEERILEVKRSRGSIIFMIVYFFLVAIFVLGPILSIILESFLYQPSRAAQRIFSTIWWRSLGEGALPALFRSLFLAFFAASASCILATLASASIKLIEMRQGEKVLIINLIRFMAAAPLVSSGIVLGLGWIVIYGRNVSPVAVVLLHAVSALPFTFNFISEGFRSLPGNTLNAAMVLGAPPLRTMLGIALPLSLKQLRSAWGFAAALSLGELNAVMMLGIRNFETLPLYIFRATGAYRFGAACAAGAMLILGFIILFLLSEGGRRKYVS